MARKILLKSDLLRTLSSGIVAFVFKGATEQNNFAFFTQNSEIAQYVHEGVDITKLESSEKIHAFDILARKVVEIHPAFFEGEVYEVAVAGEPSPYALNVDSKLYLGNITGAKSVSSRLYEQAKTLSLEDLGIKDDESFFVFDTVIEIKKGSDIEAIDYDSQYLSGIYLVRG